MIRKPFHTSKCKAFTLIEVLIVVLILGILATFMLPYFEGAQIKAKFARVLVITSRIEREMEYIIAEDGWGFNSAQAITKLQSVLADETTLTSQGYNNYVDADFAYSIGATSDTYMALYIATRSPSGSLCARCYYKPGSAVANTYGAKLWWLYENGNPWHDYIKSLLQGNVYEV